jgi:DNA-binding GntR family transcriptional regulator
MSEMSDAIFGLIVEGVYAPGEKLSEWEVAQRFGTSRTPVRQALTELASTGVISLEKNKGARVSEQSEESITAMYTARSLLEPYAARLATDYLTEDDLAELQMNAERSYSGAVNGQDLIEIASLHNKFHAIILSRCPNKRFAEITSGMLQPLVAAQTFRRYSESALRRRALHHLEIVDALTLRDHDWVESIMRAHLRSGYHRITHETAEADSFPGL